MSKSQTDAKPSTRYRPMAVYQFYALDTLYDLPCLINFSQLSIVASLTYHPASVLR